jgi:molybdopterin converting factor small subunit
VAEAQPADRTPAVTVILPGVLQRLFPGSVRRVELRAATVADAIAGLDARWPGMRDRICDSRPAIRRHMNVFVDGERAALDAPLREGSTVVVLTAVSGG